MHILILVVAMSWNVVYSGITYRSHGQVQTLEIPSFTSRQTCEEAGKKAVADLEKGAAYRTNLFATFSCVEKK